MKRGPIGVWFSVALVLFGLSAWAGYALGSRYSGYRHHRNQIEIEKSYSPERKRLESDRPQYRSLEFLRYLVNATQSNPKAYKEYLRSEISILEKQIQQPGAQGIRPVIELNLGLAYVEQAMAEEPDGDTELARKDMASAQTIFKSLGWKDYSEETLKAVARNELKGWAQNSNDGKTAK